MRSIGLSTATKSPSRRRQEGQAIVLIALLLLVLFAMLGLAIDSGRAYVDRRDLQAAVDAAALTAGDWYENYADLNGATNGALPNGTKVFQTDLHLYSGYTSITCQLPCPAYVGPLNNLPQTTYVATYPNLTLTIVATDTRFNGYQFVFMATHQLPLAFMQIFGGPTTATITASATSIVGNQRQTPAVLTLSNSTCSLNLKGSASLTLLGDAYSNGTACVDPLLKEAGNCYGAAGSTCSSASYYCYNSTPGFVPYPPPCLAGDITGQAVVPAPTLPDPGYLANSPPYYPAAQGYSQGNRGTWTEMSPGQYGAFHLTGGSASCAFLDAGVYTWTNGYTSDATGSLLSNELKAPNEELYSAPGTTSGAGIQFWNQNGVTCAGSFMLAVNIASGYGLKHGGLGVGNWGVELTSVRWDRFLDPTITPDPCFSPPGCRRESTPSACQQVYTDDTKDQVIDVSITQNAPGAQYYDVYLNPNGCDGRPNNFSFINRFLAPGWSDAGGPPAVALGPYPNGGAGMALINGTGGWPCAAPGHTICAVLASGLLPNTLCYSQTRTKNCQAPDDEIAPQCFSSCPPPPGSLTQENAPMSLQYPPFTGGDVANENYCQVSPNPGSTSAPCQAAQITPGAVQFYFPAGSCMTQNATGATYVFSGLQYNWIVIYMPASNTCANTLNGGSATQYIGTIYTPGANWTINGGNRAPLAGQVICNTLSVSGGGSVGVDFNPNYSPSPPAARLIN